MCCMRRLGCALREARDQVRDHGLLHLQVRLLWGLDIGLIICVSMVYLLVSFKAMHRMTDGSRVRGLDNIPT